MTDPLRLSIGTTNLVAARVGDPPLVRKSVLSVSGQTLGGFVERVGDPVPLVADDGTSYRADTLLVEALDALVLAAGADGSAQIAIAVPAHWTGATLRTLREAMRTSSRLAPNGTPARLVSDAVAALTALAANPGLPVRGVVALLDFGGGGTSITLADAASAFEPIETIRLPEFSGDHVDAALLAHVLDGVADDVDPAGTASVGSLTQLRDECRRAKEELSEASVADVRVELPGHRSTVQVTRVELDALLQAPLDAVLSELDDSLQRNRIEMADLAAVVAVGGGARIPLVTRTLSEANRGAFVTTPQPALDAAVGAVLFAAYGAEADAQTGVAPAPLITDAGPGPDAPGSATFRALAWSQDDDQVGDPQPYAGDDSYTVPYGDGYRGDTGRTAVVPSYQPPAGHDESRSWQRLPGLLVGVAAVIALVAVGGVAIGLTSSSDETRPQPKTVPMTATSVPATSAEPPPPPVTEQPPQSVVTITSEAPPPPPPPETVTVERPVTTTATTTQPTTTPTTTTPTTTTTTSTTTTTTTSTTSTTTTTTTTTPTMTTSYITVPFVPVPIPIQVPATPTPQYQPPQYRQQPQYPY